jgi:putative acetyltransferase
MTALPQAFRRIIRPIEPNDNPHIKTLILSTLQEHGCIGSGFASSDPELDDLYRYYHQSPDRPQESAYWVVADEAGHRISGGVGYAPLKGTPPEAGICELQKFYFLPELRGLGYGRTLLEQCLSAASRAGYREMYLETVEQMRNAISLYEKFGFRLINSTLGNTGHTGCSIFMTRLLS